MNLGKQEEENGIPNAHLERGQSISYEKRDTLMHFNTKRFWHCFYDTETGALYNEYCVKVMDDATEYLIGLGLLSKDRVLIKYFEE